MGKSIESSFARLGMLWESEAKFKNGRDSWGGKTRSLKAGKKKREEREQARGASVSRSWRLGSSHLRAGRRSAFGAGGDTGEAPLAIKLQTVMYGGGGVGGVRKSGSGRKETLAAEGLSTGDSPSRRGN